MKLLIVILIVMIIIVIMTIIMMMMMMIMIIKQMQYPAGVQRFLAVVMGVATCAGLSERTILYYTIS